MSEKKQKIYVGMGKEQTFDWGSKLKFSFGENDLQRLLENMKNGWVNIEIMKRKEPGPKGHTHYAVIDDWEPRKKDTEQAKTQEQSLPVKFVEPYTPNPQEEMPF
jgi:hypothetical protein